VLAVASVETEIYPASPFELTSTLDGQSETVKVLPTLPLHKTGPVKKNYSDIS
jgi:hypothetical protein